MGSVGAVLGGIVILFTILIFLRSVFSVKVCALCGAVSLVWITLLVLFLSGYSVDPIILSLLIGGSVVGSMYALEQKFSERYQIFKLPYFLTCIYGAYVLITKNIQIEVVYALVTIWIFGIVVYLGPQKKNLKGIGEKLIKCCKNW